MESEIFSEIISPGNAVADFDDRYEEIGRHGVFVLGRLIRHGQIWFVKSCGDFSADVAEAHLRLRKEYEVLLKLNHPGVVRVGWLEELDGVGLSLIMEMVEGETLDKFLQRATRAERKRLSELLVEVVGYVHSAGVCHLDLKPQNILVSGRGSGIRLKVVDFGMSDWAGSALFKYPGGTRGFSDPAQFEAGYAATPRSDVYALGKLLKLIAAGGVYRRAAALAANECMAQRPDDAIVLGDMIGRLRRRRMVLGTVCGVVVGLAVIVALYTLFNSRSDIVGNVGEPSGKRDDTFSILIENALPVQNYGQERQLSTAAGNSTRAENSEYGVLVEEWKEELERRLVVMKQIAANDSLPTRERRLILERMNDEMVEDTREHFRGYVERVGESVERSHPISWASIYEPAFTDVRRRMTVVYESLGE